MVDRDSSLRREQSKVICSVFALLTFQFALAFQTTYRRGIRGNIRVRRCSLLEDYEPEGDIRGLLGAAQNGGHYCNEFLRHSLHLT